MSKRAIPLILALLFALLIFVVSTLPTQTKHALHTQGVLHPWLHLVGFAALTFLLLSSTRSDLVRVLLILALLFFGYLTEVGESRRTGWAIEVKDVRSDSIGVLSGAVLSLLCFPRNRN